MTALRRLLLCLGMAAFLGCTSDLTIGSTMQSPDGSVDGAVTGDGSGPDRPTVDGPMADASTCGGSGQPCCTGNVCLPGLMCRGGVCH
jgi:hypothetical protein